MNPTASRARSLSSASSNHTEDFLAIGLSPPSLHLALTKGKSVLMVLATISNFWQLKRGFGVEEYIYRLRSSENRYPYFFPWGRNEAVLP